MTLDSSPGCSGVSGLRGHYLENGWCLFPRDSRLAGWVAGTLPAARATLTDTANARWWRCGGTWFVGVNALPNDDRGAIIGAPPLAGDAVEFIRRLVPVPGFSWDRAQVSVCRPGYPQPAATESEAAFRFRRDRDAAHVDGLLRDGPRQRRYLRQYHGFVLGIPMVEATPDASPFVIYEGSHELVREAFRARFSDVPPDQWRDIDVTDTYHTVRRRVFAECRRVEMWAKPGEAYLVHRLSVHGIAPWAERAVAPGIGRMVCYFRPEILSPRDWLNSP